MHKKQNLDLGSGRSLYVRQQGSGPELVLIHGAMTTSHDWLTSPIYEAMVGTHRVTVVDRPGHGLSRRPRFGGAPREQADQIADGLARLGIRRAAFGAHSYGALVALAIAERHPELVAELILVAPLAFPEPRLEHGMIMPRSVPVIGPLLSRFAELTRIDRPVLDILHQSMFAPAAVPAKWKSTYPYALILDAGAMVAEGEDSATMLPMSPAGTIDMRSIKARTRVLTGTSDRVVEDERQAKRLARQLPNASLTEIEGAGHMLHHSHPDLAIDALQGAFAAAA